MYRIQSLSELLSDHSSCPTSLEELSLKSEIINQKQEMINCLQEELIKVSKHCILQYSTVQEEKLGITMSN